MPSTSSEKRKGVIYTFYSYKGGVGRSMALANVAELLYQLGLRVLMIDWDLEAPGLERYFDVDTAAVLQKPGLIDLLLSYKEKMTTDLPKPDPGGKLPFETPDQYLVSVHDNPAASGRLWLLPAGKRAGDEDNLGTYGRRVREFNWRDFYENWEGELYFEWLRQQLEEMADVILIDSRTGATEIGNITTYQLADVVLIFCATNDQSREGALQMVKNFRRDIVKEVRGDRTLQTVVIPARVEDRSETVPLAEFRNRFLHDFRPFAPDFVKKDPDYLWNLKIPYFPIYSFRETVAVRQKLDERLPEMVNAYANLVDMMGRLKADSEKSVAIYEAVRYLPQVIRTGTPLLASQIASDGSGLGTTLGQDSDSSWELEVPTLPSTPSCPYPGAVPFTTDDAPFFFGRTAETRAVLQHFRTKNHFLLLVGPSGSGKTSLVQAGFVPALSRSHFWKPNFWRVLTMRPGDRPVQALAQLLDSDLDDLPGAVAAALDPRHKQSASQRGSDMEEPEGTRSTGKGQKPARQLLLIVDQLEELFSKADREERERFDSILKQLMSLEKCSLLLVIRSGALASLDSYRPDSTQAIESMPSDGAGATEANLGSAPDLRLGALMRISVSDVLVVGPLQSGELREAIYRPAEAVGVTIEGALVERLVSEAGAEPGRLPVLQRTMVSMWDQLDNQELTVGDYEALGKEGMSGLAASIVSSADAVYYSLTKEQQFIARRIFLRLVQFGEGRPNTRRQQSVAALRAVGHGEKQFEYTLATLVNNWLLISSGSSASEADTTIDVAHEALVTSWPALREWIAIYRRAESIRRRFEARATRWIESGKSPRRLLNRDELDDVQEWLDQPSADEVGFSLDLRLLVAVSSATIRRNRLVQLAAGAIVMLAAPLIVLIAYFSGFTSQWIDWVTYFALGIAVTALVSTLDTRDVISLLMRRKSRGRSPRKTKTRADD